MEEEREKIIREIEYLDALESDPKLQAVEVELCRRDLWRWLSRWVYTLDSHDSTTPFKRFPAKDYQEIYAGAWEKHNLLLVPKSRQVMITWQTVAMFLWDAQFHDGRFIFFQSKKESDADDLVRRAEFIFDAQPAWMKGRKKSSRCRLEFPDRKSIIRGIPQGGDQIRMHTASGIYMDEAAFMYQVAQAYMAAKPSIDGGGKLVMTSSANPGFFEGLVNGRIK